MLFVETSTFTRQVIELLDDEEYRRLQEVLLMRPEAGDLIPGGGGLRKLRWRVAGKGKAWRFKSDLLLGRAGRNIFHVDNLQEE